MKNKLNTEGLKLNGTLWVFHNLDYIVFLAILAFLYIFNSNIVESKLRKIDQLKTEVSESEWRYLDAKNKLMSAGSLANIEKKLVGEDLTFSGDVPQKLVAKKKLKK